MKNKIKIEERMLVTVTLNLMHKMQDFQDFKKEQGISGAYEAKVAYLVENLHVHEKTAENLLSGKVVSHNNYLEIFPSFGSESNGDTQTKLEKFAEIISKEIENGDDNTVKEVNRILSDKLDKLDLKKIVNATFIQLLEKSSQSSLKSLKNPSKRTKTLDYAWVIWNSFFYDYISKRDDQYQIFTKFNVIEKAMDYLPLIEKIFESEENLEVFCKVAERIELFKEILPVVNEWDDWENVEKFIKSVQSRNGFDNYIDIK